MKEPSPLPSGMAESISVTIPARPDYVAVVRLAAAAVAGRMGFSYEDVEDIKVAVGEACNLAIRADSQDVDVVFAILPERLEIRVSHQAPVASEEPDEAGKLGVFLIRCLVDETEFLVDGGRSSSVLTKYRPR